MEVEVEEMVLEVESTESGSQCLQGTRNSEVTRKHGSHGTSRAEEEEDAA